MQCPPVDWKARSWWQSNSNGRRPGAQLGQEMFNSVEGVYLTRWQPTVDFSGSAETSAGMNQSATIQLSRYCASGAKTSPGTSRASAERQTAQLVQERTHVGGLEQIAADSEFPGAGLVSLARFSTDYCDHGLTASSDFAQAADEFESIHSRHLQLQEHDGRRVNAGTYKSSLTAFVCFGVVPTEVQDIGHGVGGVGIVVDDKNAVVEFHVIPFTARWVGLRPKEWLGEAW